jgi:sugar phosphate isomerase/epimerase
MHRRHFLNLVGVSSILAVSGPTIAREPIERSGPPRFQFGLAAYSLRNYFSFNKGKAKKPADDGPAIDMFGFIDYCAVNGFDSAELTSYFFDANLNEDYLLRLRKYAFERGVTICGTAIGNNFTVGKGPQLDAQIADAKVWIDRAAVLGAPHIRFFAGNGAQLAKDPGRIDEACEAIDECAEHAAKKGIYLGVENHGNLSSDQMLAIMKRIKSPWVGVNLDTGNFISDDPYADLTACAPFAVNIQVKAKMKSPSGQRTDADFHRIADLLKEANYQGSVVIEYEEEKPYNHIPATLAKLKAAFTS